MRILLIQAPFTYPRPEALFTELLGIEYLAAALRAAGHHVKVLDLTVRPPISQGKARHYFGPSDEELRASLKANAPELVGISCHYELSKDHAYRVATLAKEVLPEVRTVIGGLFVSLYRTRPLEECPDLDFALVGEAEQTAVQLGAHLQSGVSGSPGIEGLAYREAGQALYQEKRNYIQDLDALPFPARDLVDLQAYMQGCVNTPVYGLGHFPTLSILTSRSCPNRCSFCNMFQVHGPRWRPRSVAGVMAELDEIVLKYGAKHVFLMDDHFTFDPDRAKAICEEIIRRPYRFRWNTPNGLSARKIDQELAQLMKRANCANVCIAIESGSEYMRHEVMNKRVSNAEIVHAVDSFRAAGLPVTGFFITGMPGETEARFQEGLAFARSLNLTAITSSFAIPFPGTALHRQLLDAGLLQDGAETRFDDLYTPAFVTPDFSRDDLFRRRRETLALFPDPGILLGIERESDRTFWGAGAPVGA